MFRGGIKGACEMLQGLNEEERENILVKMAETDPEMARLVRENLYTFEDLIYLTPKMLVELLREIEISDLAMGLRKSSTDLKKFILENVSKSIGEDIRDILDGPAQPLSKVNESISKVMEVVKAKIEKGELVLRPGAGDELV